MAKYYAFTEETLLAHDKEIVKKTKEAIDHIPMIYNGTTPPDDSLGRDGDLYIWWKIELPI